MFKHDWPRGSGRTKFHTVYTIKKVAQGCFWSTANAVKERTWRKEGASLES